MSKDEVFMVKCVAILFVVVILVALSVWALRSSMEASVFNSVTGKNVSMWQAMWIELRVQEPSK